MFSILVVTVSKCTYLRLGRVYEHRYFSLLFPHTQSRTNENKIVEKMKINNFASKPADCINAREYTKM